MRCSNRSQPNEPQISRSKGAWQGQDGPRPFILYPDGVRLIESQNVARLEGLVLPADPEFFRRAAERCLVRSGGGSSPRDFVGTPTVCAQPDKRSHDDSKRCSAPLPGREFRQFRFVEALFAKPAFPFLEGVLRLGGGVIGGDDFASRAVFSPPSDAAPAAVHAREGADSSAPSIHPRCSSACRTFR